MHGSQENSREAATDVSNSQMIDRYAEAETDAAKR